MGSPAVSRNPPLVSRPRQTGTGRPASPGIHFEFAREYRGVVPHLGKPCLAKLPARLGNRPGEGRRRIVSPDLLPPFLTHLACVLAVGGSVAPEPSAEHLLGGSPTFQFPTDAVDLAPRKSYV